MAPQLVEVDAYELHTLRRKVEDWETLIGWLLLVEAEEKRTYGEGKERHRLPHRLKSQLELVDESGVAHMRTPAYGYTKE